MKSTIVESFFAAMGCMSTDEANTRHGRTNYICLCLHAIMLTVIKIENLDTHALWEEHKDSEHRLMKLFNLNQLYVFRNEQQRLDDAYTLQGEKIAYESKTSIEQKE